MDSNKRDEQEPSFSEQVPLFNALQDSQDEWMLTLDGYVKFQLRRNAISTAGSGPLKKNLAKVLLERRVPKDPTLLDSLFEESLNHLRLTMWNTEEYVVLETSLRMQVIENARNNFIEVKNQYLAS
jgi:hypothetical protein